MIHYEYTVPLDHPSGTQFATRVYEEPPHPDVVAILGKVIIKK